MVAEGGNGRSNQAQDLTVIRLTDPRTVDQIAPRAHLIQYQQRTGSTILHRSSTPFFDDRGQMPRAVIREVARANREAGFLLNPEKPMTMFKIKTPEDH